MVAEIIVASVSCGGALAVCLINNIFQSKRLNEQSKKLASDTANAETETLKLGLQALLRDRLYSSYNKYKYDWGYAPLYAKENFENCYTQYEKLGENGVMEQIHKEFMELPTEIKGGTEK